LCPLATSDSDGYEFDGNPAAGTAALKDATDRRAAKAAGPTPGAAAAARLWQGGWALAAAASAATLLAVFGAVSDRAALGLAAAAAPAVVGYLWRPVAGARDGLLALWAIGAATAAIVTGGAAGPLAAWCAAPLLVGILYRRLIPGALASGGALLLAAVAVLRGAPAVAAGEGSVLSILALSILLGGAGATAVLLRNGAASRTVAAPPAPPPPPVDVDQRIVELEQRLAAAEAARRDAETAANSRARFLANMSHELRTPLNAIMGFSDIMRARMFGELAPKYGEYADLIHESGRHLLDLINDVLDMSKIEAARYVLTRETFDARDAVSSALRLLRVQADDSGVQLRGLLALQPIMVDADKRALKQIVINLVSNALKFTPREGSVTVTAQARRGELEIVVADTGVGIAPEDLERLGRPYEQAGDLQQRGQGTGLGLSLVKAFAVLHGGSMSIESVLGEGAAVTVRLPVLVQTGEPETRETASDAEAPEDTNEDGPPPDAPPPGAVRSSATVIQLPLSR
jgi:cell cycle sensor histidine kinase DivJ